MKARYVIPFVLVGIFSVGCAYAMTYTQAKYLMIAAAVNGNAVDLGKLNAAANSGDAVAQTWLGVYWRLKKDYAKTSYWCGKAAAQGYAPAESSLGILYAKGQGVPQDYAKADSWFEKAAAHGYARAEYNLGFLYAEGLGVPKDYVKAAYWYEKAAEQGFEKAEFALGIIYAEGLGVPKNKDIAIMWWKKAAVQGGRIGKMAQHLISLVGHG